MKLADHTPLDCYYAVRHADVNDAQFEVNTLATVRWCVCQRTF